MTTADDDAWLIALGADVSDGRPVDWDAAERRAGDTSTRRVVAELRRLAAVIGARDAGTAPAEASGGDPGGPVRQRHGDGPTAWRHLVIIERVGVGAFGSVYRAWDTRLDREVALKLLPKRPAGTRPPLDEARLLARVRHPNVVAVYGADEDDEAAGIWMEFIDGSTLADLLDAHGPMSAREAAGIGLDLCRALAALNAAGLIHRDLKAHNVMREVGGRIVLMDFSGARDAEALTTRDQLGTPLYMAPELFANRAATTASEIYSVGVLLFYLLSGRHPIEGATLKDVREDHASGERLALRELRPELSDAVVQVVDRATAREPEGRYRSAGDLERALLGVLGAEVRRESEHGDGVSRRAAWIWGTAAVLTVAALAAAASWRANARPPGSTLVQFSIASPVNTGSWPRVSPDGRWIVFGAPHQTHPVLWLRALHEPDARPLAMAEGRETPFWSPDSRSLAYFADEKLRRVDLDGVISRTLADAPAPRGGTWSRDGTLLFAPTGIAGLSRVRADGTGLAQVTRVDTARGEFEHSWPEFLPDGRRFLFIVRNRHADRGGVFVGSLDTPGHTRVMPPFSRAAYAPPGYLLFARAGSLVARRFDLDKGVVTGEELPVASGVKSHLEGDGAFDVSPTGVLVYRRNEGLLITKLVLFDRSGRELQTVGTPALYRHPRFSPGGGRIVAERATSDANADIWLFDLVRGTATRLTQHPSADLRPAWSPDGRSVAFSSARTGSSHLYKVMVDRAGEDAPLLATEGDALLNGWMPDGRSLVATLTRGGVWQLSLDGRAPVLLRGIFPQAAVEPVQSSVSPDGRWLAYMSADSGSPEVYVEPVPPTGDRWPVSIGGGGDPQWRADGRELYYVAADGWLMATSVRSVPPSFTTSRPRRLFIVTVPELHGASDYAPSPDGQRFVVSTVLGSPVVPPIQVVVNWSPPHAR